MNTKKKGFSLRDSIVGAILGRIFAIWALIVFVVSMLIIVIPVAFTNGMEEPEGTEKFRKFGKAWIHSFLFFSGCRIKPQGVGSFMPNENYIVIVNHNSLMDIPISTPEIPGPNKTIAKVELSRIPIFGVIYKRGSILVDRKDPDSRRDSYRQMKGVLSGGMHMCIYPEGTRNKTDKPLKEFQDGAFRLSVETGKAIIPALLFNTKKVLPWDKPFFFWPSKMEMHFLPPIYPDGLDAKQLKDKCHQIMSGYYKMHEHLL